MDTKLKVPLSMVLGGYISSLGFCLSWYYIKSSYAFNEILYSDASPLEKVAVVFAITAIYFLFWLLILSIRSIQKVRPSFPLASIITLLTLFLIPSICSIYYKSYGNKLSLKQNKIIKTIDRNEKERKILAANIKEIQKQLENVKQKMPTKENRKKETEAKLSNEAAIVDAVKKSITELQAKLKIEREENDKLRKQLNLTIRKTKSLEEEQKTKGHVVTQAKSDNDFPKINSKMGNTDSDTKNQEVIFKVQIISSSVPLATNSPKFRGLKNAWEYKDGGLYKYTVGNQKDLKSAYALQSEFRSKGFGGAFVVSFRDGERTPMREALRLLN